MVEKRLNIGESCPISRCAISWQQQKTARRTDFLAACNGNDCIVWDWNEAVLVCTGNCLSKPMCCDKRAVHALLSVVQYLRQQQRQQSRFILHLLSVCIYYTIYCSISIAFSALTLFVGYQEEHPACKNWLRCRHGCLPGAVCRCLHSLADATTIPKPIISFSLGLFWKRGHHTGAF